MIIEIGGRVCSGRTSTIIKLLDTNKYTVVHSLDGDFVQVYQRIKSSNIFDDFDGKLKYSFGNIVEFEENSWFGKINTSIIEDFLNSDDEVLVLDIEIPSTLIAKIKDQFKSEAYRHKTLIITHYHRIIA